MLLAERRGDTAMAETAVSQINTALEDNAKKRGECGRI